MIPYVIMMLFFGGGMAIGSIVSQAYNNPCRELVTIERARDAKVAEAEQRMHNFWTNNGKPVPRPEWGDPGLLGKRN